MLSNCPLRCHELDRRDELEMILYNRKLPYYTEQKAKLQASLEKAHKALLDHEESEKRSVRWVKLLEDSLEHHWIDNPDKYIKEWNEKNP